MRAINELNPRCMNTRHCHSKVNRARAPAVLLPQYGVLCITQGHHRKTADLGTGFSWPWPVRVSYKHCFTSRDCLCVITETRTFQPYEEDHNHLLFTA
jgi:hypothetical protein